VANVNETEEAAMVGQIIHYGCKKGYQLTDCSPKVAKCLETGKWNVSETPTCQLIRCPQPPVVKNGKLDGNGKKEYSNLDSVKYECHFVDILEDGIITPIYPPSDGQKTGQQCPMALKFSCQDGYDLVSSALTECTSTGEWNHPFPACVPWPCESPPISPNSQIQSKFIRPDIITAIVRCDPGFRLLGSNLTCGPAGI
jgi:CUB/sushi domain-containing protein